MPDTRFQNWFPISPDIDRQTFAAGAIALWIVLEFAFRRGLVPVLTDPLGTGRGADAVMLTFAFPLIALFIAWWGLQNGIGPADWEYTISIRNIGAGLIGWAGSLVFLGSLAFVYTSLLGWEPSVGPGELGLTQAPTWVLVLFFVGNGIVVPITEELAWRGVIQTSLTEASGTTVAVVVTALAFVLKHLLVDLSAPLFRVTTLVVLAFVLGILRARYGTASSTVAHVAANGLSTALLILG